MSISDEAVRALHEGLPGWASDYLDPETIRAALEAAAPHVLADDRAEVWADGHENGFWNGRTSSGEASDAALIGKKHAETDNPYRTTK